MPLQVCTPLLLNGYNHGVIIITVSESEKQQNQEMQENEC